MIGGIQRVVTEEFFPICTIRIIKIPCLEIIAEPELSIDPVGICFRLIRLAPIYSFAEDLSSRPLGSPPLKFSSNFFQNQLPHEYFQPWHEVRPNWSE